MLQTEFVPNSTSLGGAVKASNFNYDAKFALNIMQICQKKLVQIKCYKGGDTKMQTCLVRK